MNKGAEVSARRSRKRSIKKYYEKPNVCKHCFKIIEVKEGQKVAEVRLKKFCNRSCAAKFNNKDRVLKDPPDTKCRVCSCTIKNELAITGKNRFTRKSVCDTCRYISKDPIDIRKKGDYFKERGNWQSARSGIAKNARKRISSFKRECKICGYTNCVEVAHIKAVSDFDDNALISEINDPNNLIYLCPNHHWEFDHGILIIE